VPGVQKTTNNAKETTMNLRFITRQVHAYLDYPVAISLMAMPIVLGLGVSNPLAKWLSIATGVAAFVLTVLTDHELGVIKVLPFWFHVAVDRVVGLTFVVAPFVLGFSGLDAGYYWANGAAVLTVTCLLNAPVANKSPAQTVA
jgi:hypothetical protein